MRGDRARVIRRLRGLGYSGYESYLRGRWWRRRRLAFLARFEAVCSCCGGRERVQLHHRSYERVGAELDEDLAWLCAGCALPADASGLRCAPSAREAWAWRAERDRLARDVSASATAVEGAARRGDERAARGGGYRPSFEQAVRRHLEAQLTLARHDADAAAEARLLGIARRHGWSTVR